MQAKIRSQFSVRFKNTVDPRVLEFANCQSNFTDTILYLIEKEIAENGVRNLQQHVPLVRNILQGGHVPTVQVPVINEVLKTEGLTVENKVSDPVIAAPIIEEQKIEQPVVKEQVIEDSHKDHIKSVSQSNSVEIKGEEEEVVIPSSYL